MDGWVLRFILYYLICLACIEVGLNGLMSSSQNMHHPHLQTKDLLIELGHADHMQLKLHSQLWK